MGRTLISTSIPGQGGPGSNGNEEVRHIPQIFKTGLDGLGFMVYQSGYLMPNPYIYIYLSLKKKKTKTCYFRIINLFPSCFAFLVWTKNTKKNITGPLQDK